MRHVDSVAPAARFLPRPVWEKMNMTIASKKHGLALAAGAFVLGLGFAGGPGTARAEETRSDMATTSGQPVEMQRRGGGGGFRGGGGGAAFRGGGGGFRPGGFAGGGFRGGMIAPGGGAFRAGVARPAIVPRVGGPGFAPRGGAVAGNFINRAPLAPGFRPPGGWVRPGFVRYPRPGFIFYPGYGYWYPGYSFYPGYGWALLGGAAVGAAVVGTGYGDCWIERRWVDGPWGPEVRRVRVCNGY
ncbi:MAG: hypothetical protein QM722_00450 [Piscinibacter sp.]